MSSQFRKLLLAATVWLVLGISPASSAEVSNLFLPGHVIAEEGRVSLFADYNTTRDDGHIPVYLVNKSTDDLVLNAQDGDIYLKLQYRDADGEWTRAQPHAYSWCGNSYYEKTLRAGHHVVVSGYQNADGIPQEIRYELYSQSVPLISNVGHGLVSELDIRRASSDVMSLHEGSFEYVSEVALSPEPVENKLHHLRDLRISAVGELGSGRFDRDKSKAVLEEVRENNPALEAAAERALAGLKMAAAAEDQSK